MEHILIDRLNAENKRLALVQQQMLDYSDTVDSQEVRALIYEKIVKLYCRIYANRLAVNSLSQ